MHVTVQKWGNSLGVRIPKTLTKEANIDEGTEVEMSIENGKITIKPVKQHPTLDELLSKVTKDNIHSETVTGSIVGREIW